MMIKTGKLQTVWRRDKYRGVVQIMLRKIFKDDRTRSFF